MGKCLQLSADLCEAFSADLCEAFWRASVPPVACAPLPQDRFYVKRLSLPELSDVGAAPAPQPATPCAVREFVPARTYLRMNEEACRGKREEAKSQVPTTIGYPAPRAGNASASLSSTLPRVLASRCAR
eukprot:327310-Pleurochrysis_carterae.AAC.13